jgi:polysaccharide deacetylase family protein (PEP-CTERM system associated)
MSIDVEEHFHAAALAPGAPRTVWPSLESRVERSTQTALDLFAAAGVKATFFTLGMVAERAPRLIRRIVAEGHELASHGHAHFRVREQTPRDFRADLIRAKGLLEDAGGVEVTGYRAPNFSIEAATWWAYDILAETGHRYSSSINPVRHDHYGLPDAPLVPFRPAGTGLVEIPMTVVDAAGHRWHVSGGGWFRLMPYPLFRAATRRVAEGARRRPVFYFHPWEVDPGQPRVDVPARARFRHYVNLGAMEGKLARLLQDFGWARIDQVFAAELSNAQGLEEWAPADAMTLALAGQDGD